MRTISVATLGLIAVGLSACASSSSKGDYGGPIKTTDQVSVSDCEFVSDVHASSPFYGMLAGPAMRAAREAAYKEAEKLDATHMVWGEVESDYGGTQAHGAAYRCD